MSEQTPLTAEPLHLTAAETCQPSYETSDRSMRQSRSPRAEALAELILTTVQPYLQKTVDQIRVLDVGSGYGDTSLALAQRCYSVDGVEPATRLIQAAEESRVRTEASNVRFRQVPAESLTDDELYDLIVLDNVYEHLASQEAALKAIAKALAPGGVCLLIAPNKLWPIEVHYGLPFLSYLPVRAASALLRWTGRGTDYTDCSYAPTYLGLKRSLRKLPGTTFHFVVPRAIHLAAGGRTLLYRSGAALLRRCPTLWWISKAFVVVIVKTTDHSPDKGRES